jgi:multidrug efflux pump subunit AcrA (membrane-fusion protein)
MRKKKRRWIWWTGSLVVLAAAAAFVLLGFRGSGNDNGQAGTRAYSVETASRQEIVEVSGNIGPVESGDVSFGVSGQLAALFVQEGDTVTEGTLLASLDDMKESYELEAHDYEMDQEELTGSWRKLELLESERELKALALEDTKLYSPIGGLVSSVDVGVGQYVKAGERIARIIDISSLSAEVEIDELDAPAVSVGQDVVLHFDAYPDLEVEAKVTSLPFEGRVTSQGIAVLDAEVRIDDPPEEILPSYSFVGEILVSDAETVLVIDANAVLQMGERSVVFLPGEEDGQPIPRPVETAVLGDGRVRILSGLSEGDTVLSAAEIAQPSQDQQEEGRGILPLLGGGGRALGGGRPSGEGQGGTPPQGGR